MAIGNVSTLLPLEEYARIMAIPDWHFNQVELTTRPVHSSCDQIWLQTGWAGDPNRIVGRDELSQAIATAETTIADVCGFWPAPRWVQAEHREWVNPARGQRNNYPQYHTQRGYLISGGKEAWELLAAGVTIAYSDRDDDEVDDWATITVDLSGTYLYLYLYNSPLGCEECELAVVPVGKNPATQEWRIRPLRFTDLGSRVYRIEGPRWWFVDPDEYLQYQPIPATEADAFLEEVDIYCHFNDSTKQGAYFWRDADCSLPGGSVQQNLLATVLDRRTGKFYAQTATHTDGGWVRADWPVAEEPDYMRFWYYAGYVDNVSGPCDWMGASMKEAIVRLANVYLAESPCGCTHTHERWVRDTEEVKIDNVDAAMAQTHFGTTARGAIFAYSVIRKLPPLGKGG